MVEHREKDRFAEAITDDAVKILGADRKDVIVVFQEEPLHQVLDFEQI